MTHPIKFELIPDSMWEGAEDKTPMLLGFALTAIGFKHVLKVPDHLWHRKCGHDNYTAMMMPLDNFDLLMSEGQLHVTLIGLANADISIPPRVHKIDDYWVIQDGHHRIARAIILGYKEIHVEALIFPEA